MATAAKAELMAILEKYIMVLEMDTWGRKYRRTRTMRV